MTPRTVLEGVDFDELYARWEGMKQERDEARAIARRLATSIHTLWDVEAAYMARTGQTHATLRVNTQAADAVERTVADFDALPWAKDSEGDAV